MIKRRFNNEVWGIIPARGGSQSIPRKNLIKLAGRPLLDYVFYAGKASSLLHRIICSTEDKAIASRCREINLEVHKRPRHLAGDYTPIVQVLINLLDDMYEKEGVNPFAFALLQVTSPFVLPEHIDMCVEALTKDKRANSAQTISKFPHNYHAYNQRIVNNGYIRFKFPRKRRIHYSKQTKPLFYIFGNLVVTKSRALLQRKNVFSTPSIPILIPHYYAFDLDSPDDSELAEYLISSKKVLLPHISSNKS